VGREKVGMVVGMAVREAAAGEEEEAGVMVGVGEVVGRVGWVGGEVVVAVGAGEVAVGAVGAGEEAVVGEGEEKGVAVEAVGVD
jgi:hypothetical protein